MVAHCWQNRQISTPITKMSGKRRSQSQEQWQECVIRVGITCILWSFYYWKEKIVKKQERSSCQKSIKNFLGDMSSFCEGEVLSSCKLFYITGKKPVVKFHRRFCYLKCEAYFFVCFWCMHWQDCPKTNSCTNLCLPSCEITFDSLVEKQKISTFDCWVQNLCNKDELLIDSSLWISKNCS